MTFPDRVYTDAGSYVVAYREEIIRAWQSVRADAMDRAVAILSAAITSRRTIFACGNGGSAAIANHLACDHLKGVQLDTSLRPKVVSLAHLELLTAIANDVAFEEVFVYPLRTMAEPGDVLMTISASGNSENIVRSVIWARENGVRTIAFTGFDGGRSGHLADVNLHVNAFNYGIVEDIHQSLMHCLAHSVRMQAMPRDLTWPRRF